MKADAELLEEDEVMQDLRRIRTAIGEQVGWDVHRLFAYLRVREQEAAAQPASARVAEDSPAS